MSKLRLPNDEAHLNTGIYCIEHLESGKKYVGSAVDFGKRWSSHRSMLRNGRHHSQYLQRAWDKHGEAAFRFRQLLVCSEQDLVMYEQRLIDGYNVMNPAGFNARPQADSQRGLIHSEEARAKMRAKVISPEARRRLSVAHRGRRDPPELVEKRAAALRGKPRAIPITEVAKAKMRDAHGRKMSMMIADEIRTLCANGSTRRAVATQYGVALQTVTDIVLGRRWKRYAHESDLRLAG